MASNKQNKKATMTYVVDDLEGNFECCDDHYDSITDIFDEIAEHLQGEYDDDEGKCGEVKTKRVKKIEIWINHDKDTLYQEEKPDLKWEIQDSCLVAYDDTEIDPTKRELDDPLYECRCNECDEQNLAVDMVNEGQDGDCCIECYEQRPAVIAYKTAIANRLRNADIP